MKILFLISLLGFMVLPASPQNNITLSSPDESLRYTFSMKDHHPVYSISFLKKPLIIDAEIGLSFFGEKDFKNDLKILKPAYSSGTEKYELVVGKTKSVNDPYREVVIPIQESSEPHRKINIRVRAFREGIAFRYEFQEQQNNNTFTLTEENTAFRFVENPQVIALFLPGFNTSHEGRYSHLPWNEIKEDTLMDVPALFEFAGPVYLAITEADLVDYAGMYLVKHLGVLTSRLSPLPGRNIKVVASLPHPSPWRVIMISNRIGAFVESNMITSLSEPCKIHDVAWIRPGKTTWPWWNGDILPDTSFTPGNNFESEKYYIDFCARNGLEYHSVVEYGGHEWYTSDGEGFSPGAHTDVTKPVPGLDMLKVCEYAKSKHVGIRLWVHWAALYPQIDSAFSQYEKWGIQGLMVDFMDREDQLMVNIQEEILQKAAVHHLHIQFHGVGKPTGLSRTWPNELTREGAMNYEYDKWSTRMTPDHDIDIPFTRMLAGPVDYHLGGFRAVPDSLFKIQYTRPLVYGTRCHMLAMYVVLESYLSMVCDYPAAYSDQPGFDFIRGVPATWDETRVQEAVPGQFIVVARRKGDDWFVGSITNHAARKIIIPMGFLGDGQFQTTLYRDASGSNPNALIQQDLHVNKSDTLSVDLSAGGGMVMHISRNKLTPY